MKCPLSARPAKNARLGVRPGAHKPQRKKKLIVAAIAHGRAFIVIRAGRQGASEQCDAREA